MKRQAIPPRATMFRGRGCGACPHRCVAGADRVKADGLAAGRVLSSRRRCRGACAIDAMLATAGGRCRHRGVPRGEEASLCRLRRHRVLRSPQPGPQADLRRRHRPQHRRDGRVLASAGGHAHVHARVCRRSCCRPSRHGRRSMPFSGFLYAGLMIDARCRPDGRVQLPLGDRRTADPDAAEERPVRAVMQATRTTLPRLEDIELQWDRRVASAW